MKKYGADLDAKDSVWSRTVLHWSVYNPILVMKTLLELGADRNIQDRNGDTVLAFLERAVSDRQIVDYKAKFELLNNGPKLSSTTAKSGAYVPPALRRDMHAKQPRVLEQNRSRAPQPRASTTYGARPSLVHHSRAASSNERW